MKLSALFTLAFCLAVSARPARRAAFTLKNGQDAIALKYVASPALRQFAHADGDIVTVSRVLQPTALVHLGMMLVLMANSHNVTVASSY
jgi:hypothetical protein